MNTKKYSEYKSYQTKYICIKYILIVIINWDKIKITNIFENE